MVISSQSLPPQHLRLHRQAATLIVAEQKALLAEFLHQDLDLRALEVDHRLLSSIHPACQGYEQKLPRLKHKVHVSPASGVKVKSAASVAKSCLSMGQIRFVRVA